MKGFAASCAIVELRLIPINKDTKTIRRIHNPLKSDF
jgi:hypothetical protein